MHLGLFPSMCFLKLLVAIGLQSESPAITIKQSASCPMLHLCLALIHKQLARPGVAF